MLAKYLPSLRLGKKEGKRSVFDPVRKKWIILSPEEMVRQVVIAYLIDEKDYSPRLMSVERAIEFNTMTRRYDLVVFDKYKNPLILVECKSPDKPLNRASFEQVALYNESLGVQFLWLTNGHTNYFFQINNEKRSVKPCNDIPEAKTLN